MRLSDLPVFDARPLLKAERADLLALLASLSQHEWSAATAVPGWTVKDLALHLLDDDLGWLSRGRDHDASSLLNEGDHPTFIAALAAKNQRWIDGTRGLSLPVVTGLLEWSGREIDAYYDSMDLADAGEVAWASNDAVPVWFDLCQDLTERWVHQMQMREAIDRVEDYAQRYLSVVLRTFVWAFPHQFHVDAPPGTTIRLDLACGGVWRLTCAGGATWELDEGEPASADASAAYDDDAGWRSLTAGNLPPGSAVLEGPTELVEPLLQVRGILA